MLFTCKRIHGVIEIDISGKGYGDTEGMPCSDTCGEINLNDGQTFLTLKMADMFNQNINVPRKKLLIH